ncbi:helix-turn-helix transcriptional regulator [Zobellia galactanivorans]|uniref:Cro/C1-type transcriptional regulator n=1 Tax=Zobellia galactanivorans (strain DSM 12802 / CCUG 47099 / CIP 106680 / NCIMB 13871 / Dsij) TaxID=63186 RepID=G0L6V7_ZOBGA|nr:MULTISPECIES: helix-turn-helix transcriptional regulator [Zobellia]MDO6809017.1 helix-turn-helix transcriptional regulator [Zobellia galactanivorans]OWW25987.1 transcriptional regulator [Zobellia sp. OII3]CAZ98676.1 Cro/C1-type transcriptional regulator [Zobellia galactanivorans]
MVNTTDFIQRLEHLLSYYGLSASGFADKINVQRSSISHLLSGRNKPSLDFVLKVVKAFPEVNLYWLLNGKGSFPSEPKPEEPPRPKPQAPSSTPQSIVQKAVAESKKTIEKIVIFYSDGSFKAYDNK